MPRETAAVLARSVYTVHTTMQIYYKYRMFKNVFAPEDYLQILPINLACTFVHFRTLNHRLPIQRGRVLNLPYEDRLCNECSSVDIGDEFHYVFSCPFFFFFFLRNPEEKKYLSPFYCKNANVNRFQSFLQ